MQVIKRDKSKEEFDISKINRAVKKAFESCNKKMPQYLGDMIHALFSTLEGDTIGIEEIQNNRVDMLCEFFYESSRILFHCHSFILLVLNTEYHCADTF